MRIDYSLAPIERFFSEGAKLIYKKNEHIIRPGETPSGVFYIKEGYVNAYTISKYGEENLLIIRKPNEIFPFIWTMTGKDHEILYQALTDLTVYKIPRQDFLNIVNTQPKLLEPLLIMTIEMFRTQNARIMNLGYRTVKERLISFLVLTSENYGDQKTDNSATISIPLRHHQIASSISATRETVSRELSSLEKQNLISIDPYKITIKDLGKLQTYL